MTCNQTQLLNLLKSCKALQFGEFVTKSGRKTNYFVNIGQVHSTKDLQELSQIIADYILQNLKIDWSKPLVVYGPAYKGIPLSVATVYTLLEAGKKNVSYSFNDKEQKGIFYGTNILVVSPDTQILIVEDVLTAGTSLRETFETFKNISANILGALVVVDREEKGLTSERLARVEIAEDFKTTVWSLIKASDLSLRA